MYQFIYDSFLTDEKYSKILTFIENRLVDLGLEGQRDRLNLFKNFQEIILAGRKKGVKTVVAVGNDATLGQLINALDSVDVTVGVIPVGPQNKIAKILGIGEGILACDCLSNRLIKKIDVGKINDYYFLSHLEASSSELSLRCGNKYRIKLVEKNKVGIYNLPTFSEKADPQDGYLEARVKPVDKNFFSQIKGRCFSKFRESNQSSFFPVKKIYLESDKESSILVDNWKTVNTPAEVQILPQKLKIIVGKNRLF